jgi:hypothetical protein
VKAEYPEEMATQTITIQIAPRIAQLLLALQRRAEAEGISLDSLLAPLVPENGVGQDAPTLPPNLVMLQALEETRELLKDMPVRGSTEESLKILREGRAGRMWGYEPAQ